MKKLILTFLIFILLTGYTQPSKQYVTTTSTNFGWNKNVVEFRYIGPTDISDELLNTLVIKTMDSMNDSCNDSIPNIPTMLTINGVPKTILSSIEYKTSDKCSPTKSLQNTVMFDDIGNITNSFTTFN